MYASAISEEIILNLMFIQYTTLLMSHLEYISAHNLASGSPSAHTAIKHLQSPLLPVAFLLFLYQHVK